MVVVDKINKITHFLPVQSSYKTVQVDDIFMNKVFQLHGIPKVVISDRDVKFTFTFWKALFIGLRIQI